MSENNYSLSAIRRCWDEEAASFDEEPDHGLADPVVRAAWRNLLQESLPPLPAAILDIGCGTGSLSILIATLGYVVSGLDLSPAMIARAQTKAGDAGYDILFHLGDAADPRLGQGDFDAIVCRFALTRTISTISLADGDEDDAQDNGRASY